MKGEVQLEVTSAENPSPSDADPLLENHADSSSPGSSSSIEIRNEDIEAGSNSCCRICLESDAEPGQFFFAYRFDFLFFEFDHNSSFIRNMYNLYLSEQVGFLLKNQELQHRTTNKNRELILCKVPYSIIIIKKKSYPVHKAQFFFFFWERLIPGIEPWTFCIGWNLLIIERRLDILPYSVQIFWNFIPCDPS